MSHLGEEIAALVDGELSHDARDRALAHLAVCADCRARAEAERRTKAIISGLHEPAPTSELTTRLAQLPGELRLPHGLRAGSAWFADRRPRRRRGDARPTDGRPRGRAPHRRRRVSVAAGGVVLVGACMTAFAAGGGPSSDRPVSPQMDRFSVEHAAVTPEVPLSDQGDPGVVVSYPLPTPTP